MSSVRTEIITSVGTIEVDAVLNITDTYRNSLNKYRIEGGSEITENSYSENPKISLTGIFSDASIIEKNESVTVTQDKFPEYTPGFITTALGTPKKPEVRVNGIEATDDNNLKSLQYKLQLIFVRDQGELITIRTPIELYEDVLITSIEFTKDKSNGGSVRFRMNLEKPSFAFSKFVEEKKKPEQDEKALVPTEEAGTKATDAVDPASDQGVTSLQRFVKARPGEDLIDLFVIPLAEKLLDIEI